MNSRVRKLKTSWLCIQSTNIWVSLNCQEWRYLQSETEQREIILFSSGNRRRLNFPVLWYLHETKWCIWGNGMLPTSNPFFLSPTVPAPFFSARIMERTGVTTAQWSHWVERLMPQPSCQNWPTFHCTVVSKQQTFISITFCHRIWMLHTLTNTDYIFLPPHSCCYHNLSFGRLK